MSATQIRMSSLHSESCQTRCHPVPMCPKPDYSKPCERLAKCDEDESDASKLHQISSESSRAAGASSTTALVSSGPVWPFACVIG